MNRSLESMIHVSSRSNLALIPFTCFASKNSKRLSFIWFVCKNVDDFCVICDNLAPMILNIDALCVAQNKLNNFPFICFVCNHIAILDMTCHVCYHFDSIAIAPNMMKTCYFLWFVCTHVDEDVLHIDLCILFDIFVLC
jgi:hypothetical protein